MSHRELKSRAKAVIVDALSAPDAGPDAALPYFRRMESIITEMVEPLPARDLVAALRRQVEKRRGHTLHSMAEWMQKQTLPALAALDPDDVIVAEPVADETD